MHPWRQGLTNESSLLSLNTQLTLCDANWPASLSRKIRYIMAWRRVSVHADSGPCFIDPRSLDTVGMWRGNIFRTVVRRILNIVIGDLATISNVRFKGRFRFRAEQPRRSLKYILPAVVEHDELVVISKTLVFDFRSHSMGTHKQRASNPLPNRSVRTQNSL